MRPSCEQRFDTISSITWARRSSLVLSLHHIFAPRPAFNDRHPSTWNMLPNSKRRRVDGGPATLGMTGSKSTTPSKGSLTQAQKPQPSADADGQQSGKAFVTASSGDAYMMHSSAPAKTSDNLLSTIIDPAFTLASYAQTLAQYDNVYCSRANEQGVAEEIVSQQYESEFPSWLEELEQGFNLLLHGFGSKISVMDSFAKRASTRGHVVVVRGFDALANLGELVAAIEGCVDGGDASESRIKGKGPALIVPPGVGVQVSAIEGKVRRVCKALAVGVAQRDVFLVIHNIDAPALRQAKTISLIALLAAQPRIHLIASVDHIRAALIFPIHLATARPSSTTGTSVDLETRALTLVYHEVSTRVPYTVEVAATAVLSRLLPASIYPHTLDNTNIGTASLARSAYHVLQSVGVRPRKLFRLVATLQAEAIETLSDSIKRTLVLTPAATAPSPAIATLASTVKSLAQDELFIASGEQVEMLWAEFMDHGVFRASVIPPVGAEDDGDGRGTWIWIPLAKDELAEVLEQLEDM